MPISIEFDTYYNSGSPDYIDSKLDKNGDKGHIAVVTPSINNYGKNIEHHKAVTYAPEKLAQKKWRTVVFNWDAAKQDLSYDLSGIGAATYHIDDVQKQFGGDFVHWGFTSSTGGSKQDNAVAVTEIPSSVVHTAKIKNESMNTDFSTAIDASPGEVVTINDSITLDELVPNFGEEAIVEMNMAGIDYISESLVVNDIPVPSENIIYADNKLTVNFGKLVDTTPAVFDFKAKVAKADPGTVLNYDLTYDDEPELVDSNNLQITVQEAKDKTIKVNYLDIDTQQELAPSTDLTQMLGETYTATPLDIADYALDSDSGNTTGVMTEETSDVTFYYHRAEVTLNSAPSLLNFGENMIASQDLNLKPVSDKDLIISDTRVDGKRQEWTLLLKMSEALINADSSVDLTPGLTYTNHQKLAQTLSGADIVVEQTTHETEGNLNLSEAWASDEGFKLNVPSERQKIDDFSGQLAWTLQKSVVNREV